MKWDGGCDCAAPNTHVRWFMRSAASRGAPDTTGGRLRSTIVRAYRTALDPTTEQRKKLVSQAGAARWAYNWALGRWREHYEQHKRGARVNKPSWMALCKEFTQVKRQPETAWLYEVSAYVTVAAIEDVGDAYKHFFRRLREGLRGKAAGEPQFRPRNERSGRGFCCYQPSALGVRDDSVLIPGVGWVRLHERDYIPPGSDCRGLACRDIGGRWYVALQVEEEMPDSKENPRTADRVGVEVGVRVLAQTSDGDTFRAVRDHAGLQRIERRRKLWERRIARRYKRGAKSREQSRGLHEAVRKVARLHATCADLRRDKLHQTTTRIVRKAAGATIVLRDMQVARMLGRAGKNGSEARTRNAIAPMLAKVGIHELRRQIEYKQRFSGATRRCDSCGGTSEHGIKTCPKCQGSGQVARVEIAPTEYPSTRTCNACRVVRDSDPGYPSWTCGGCGHRHDREQNSACNLRDFAGGSPSGGNGGQADRRRTARKAAQRPAEPDQSASEANTALATIPDGGRAVSAAFASLGSGNRAEGPRGATETDGGDHIVDPTGGAESARRLSTSIPIQQSGRALAGSCHDHGGDNPAGGSDNPEVST